MHKTKSIRSNKKKIQTVIKAGVILVTIVSLILILYTLMSYETLEEKFSTQVQDYGIISLFTLSLLLDLLPQLISPIIILAAAIVAGVNIHYAIITTILGSTSGSLIGFILGKKYMYTAVDTLTSKKATKRLTKLTNKYGKIVVPIAAISPLPYLPVLLGAMNFSKRNFLIYGLIPRTISFIVFGYLIKII
jgi:membrane protein YqaA with SNARE-associated domain